MRSSSRASTSSWESLARTPPSRCGRQKRCSGGSVRGCCPTSQPTWWPSATRAPISARASARSSNVDPQRGKASDLGIAMVRFAARATIDEHDATHDIDVVWLEGSHQRRRGAVGAVGMIRFHEEQRFRKATIALLLVVIAFVVFVKVAALTISRPDEVIIATITALAVVRVAL